LARQHNTRGMRRSRRPLPRLLRLPRRSSHSFHLRPIPKGASRLWSFARLCDGKCPVTALNTLPTRLGTVGATPIVANVNSATLAAKRFVTLTANYDRHAPPGYPDPSPGGVISKSLTAFPQTITSSKRLQLFSCEAQALVSAGAATYS
jgi:hypothetical protein